VMFARMPLLVFAPIFSGHLQAHFDGRPRLRDGGSGFIKCVVAARTGSALVLTLTFRYKPKKPHRRLLHRHAVSRTACMTTKIILDGQWGLMNTVE